LQIEWKQNFPPEGKGRTKGRGKQGKQKERKKEGISILSFV
jgi:hypothetical protein